MKLKNNSDVIYTPTVLAYVITEYARNKKYIDRDNAWWFYQKHDLARLNELLLSLSLTPIYNADLETLKEANNLVSLYRELVRYIYPSQICYG